MTHSHPENTPATVSQKINLGQHHLVLLSDQSIELMRDEQATSQTEYVFNLDNYEAYRLMICLQEMFKEAQGG
ncbi:MAG TPA: hypothetical protein VH593_00700 [Ktedonobacteraceae bacterium]